MLISNCRRRVPLPGKGKMFIALFGTLIVGLVPYQFVRAQTKDLNEKSNQQQPTSPITVTGRVLSPTGDPVANARVFICSTTTYSRLANTRTNEEGHYQFSNVALPIEMAGDSPGSEDQGGFEVFALADEMENTLSFGWRPKKTYLPTRSTNGRMIPEGADLPTRFAEDDPIELDIHLTESSELRGRLVDDEGKPISGATISLFNAEPTTQAGYDNSDEFLRIGPRDFELLYVNNLMPDDLRNRQTDENGLFIFDTLPAETDFCISIKAEGFPRRKIFCTTSDMSLFRFDDVKVFANDFKLVMARPRPVPVRIVHDDTGGPAAHVFVSIFGETANASCLTDEKGEGSLKMPPGVWSFRILPKYQTPYILFSDSFEIPGHDHPAKTLEIRLKKAAEVELTIVDADTGDPIEGARLSLVEGGSIREYTWRSFKRPRTAMVERPPSSAEGKMLVYFEPGDYELLVEKTRSEYRSKSIKIKDCTGAELTAVTVKLKKRN